MTSKDPFDLCRLPVPVECDLARSLVDFWETVFGGPCDWGTDVLSGAEAGGNIDVIYIAQEDDRVASTCRLTISRSDARLGLLGEVATSEQCRGKGLARDLCGQALREFRARGGAALFLATSNPAAAALYSGLGWRQLPGSNVMVNADFVGQPGAFLADYFASGNNLSVEILRGSARHRAPIVPLIVTPHDYDVMDANASICSTRYVNQPSCEGLYHKYADLATSGVWFVAERADGAAVGISSVKRMEDGSHCAEAFTHPDYDEKCLGLLYEAAIEWAKDHGAASVYTTCSTSNVAKRTALERLSGTISLSVREVD